MLKLCCIFKLFSDQTKFVFLASLAVDFIRRKLCRGYDALEELGVAVVDEIKKVSEDKPQDGGIPHIERKMHMECDEQGLSSIV